MAFQMSTTMARHVMVLTGAMLCMACTPIAAGQSFKLVRQRPADFVDVGKAIRQMQFDMRYASSHNFVGRRVHGYEGPACLLTKPAVAALKSVEAKLLRMGLTLKAYDCYRPQRAVDDFANWAADLKATQMQAEFYAAVPKNRLFEEGYIAAHSGHSRGSTIDLTIVPIDSNIPHVAADMPLVDCVAPKQQRAPDNSLDFGTGFDCFSPVSHPSYQAISPQAKANRLLLQTLMMAAGFMPLETEWWHFTLKDEPYPDTYFDFPVRHISR
jgi:D-alanyl-D-alanine dipeptidase